MGRVLLVVAFALFIVAFIVSLGAAFVMGAISWALLGFVAWVGALLS